jgi:uncharacterized membrane protein
MRWAEVAWLRLLVSLVAAAVTLIAIAPFAHAATRVIVAWNVFVTVLLASTAVMMWRSSPEQTRQRARNEEPSNVLILLTTILTAAVGLGGIAYAQLRIDGMSRLDLGLHTVYSILGVLLAWFLIHSVSALPYAKLYYDETEDHDEDAFQKGLAFPGERDVVDYWDFVYYSFTIAMCYQTSDVTITSPSMRRLTIFHATVSFIFVLVILGMLINIIGNVI